MNKIDTIIREAKGKILTRKDFDSLANKYSFNKDTLRKVMLNKNRHLDKFGKSRKIHYDFPL